MCYIERMQPLASCAPMQQYQVCLVSLSWSNAVDGVSGHRALREDVAIDSPCPFAKTKCCAFVGTLRPRSMLVTLPLIRWHQTQTRPAKTVVADGRPARGRASWQCHARSQRQKVVQFARHNESCRATRTFGWVRIYHNKTSHFSVAIPRSIRHRAYVKATCARNSATRFDLVGTKRAEYQNCRWHAPLMHSVHDIARFQRNQGPLM